MTDCAECGEPRLPVKAYIKVQKRVISGYGASKARKTIVAAYKRTGAAIKEKIGELQRSGEKKRKIFYFSVDKVGRRSIIVNVMELRESNLFQSFTARVSISVTNTALLVSVIKPWPPFFRCHYGITRNPHNSGR